MFFFLCNSILEKLYYLLLHVESGRFLVLLEFLSCCYWCCCYRKEHKLLLMLLLLLLKGACIVIFLLTNKVVLRIDVLPSSILPSYVLHLVVMCLTSYCLTSYVVQYANLPFHPPFIWLPSNLWSASVGCSFNLHLTFVYRWSFPTTHHILQTICCVRIL